MKYLVLKTYPNNEVMNNGFILKSLERKYLSTIKNRYEDVKDFTARDRGLMKVSYKEDGIIFYEYQGEDFEEQFTNFIIEKDGGVLDLDTETFQKVRDNSVRIVTSKLTIYKDGYLQYVGLTNREDECFFSDEIKLNRIL